LRSLRLGDNCVGAERILRRWWGSKAGASVDSSMRVVDKARSEALGVGGVAGCEREELA
jgi:hypothetical protein